MKVQWKWMKLCMIATVFFFTGRMGAANCTTECDDIDGYLRWTGTVYKCWVFATVPDDDDDNPEPSTVVPQCSRRSAPPYWVPSGINVECFSYESKVAIFDCPLTQCDDLCQQKPSNKAITYTADQDPNLGGKQIDHQNCTLVTPSLTHKVCDIAPPSTGP